MSGQVPQSRILVIEDEPVIALAMEDALLAAEYKVVGPVSRLEKAVEAAQQDAFEAAVVDLDFHGELALAVGRALSARRIPFAFITGYTENTPRVPQDLWHTLV